MRRFLILLLCLSVLILPVFAETEPATDPSGTDATASEPAQTQPETTPAPQPAPEAPPVAAPSAFGGVIHSYHMDAVVGLQGTVQVTAVVDLTLTEPTTRLVIPLGENASNCTVNGVRLGIKKENGVPCVSLRNKDGLIGDLRINMTYQLGRCISARDGLLTLPILPSSYAYPISAASFTVTLPKEPSAIPAFHSAYLGEDADNYMDIQIDGAILTGTLLTSLRDHDSIGLSLSVPELVGRTYDEAGTTLKVVNILVAALAGLAFLYWALRLSWRPVSVGFQTHPPLGETAGETEALLKGTSLNFSLMVLTWAQMGYLTIQKDRDVTLYRRMDMGNERSPLERQAFARLFRRRRSISATGSEFQRLRAQIDSMRPRAAGQFTSNSGNPMILKLLGVLAGLAAGVGIGDSLLPPIAVRFLPLILFALAGGWASYWIQNGVNALLSRDKAPLWKGLLSLAGLCILGSMGGQLGLALACALIQILVGLTAMFGGRRTEDGRRTVQGELGMVRFFCFEYKERHQTAQHQNPSYYYDLAPYALALGVDRIFARRFEKMSLLPCTWLRCRPKDATAAQWDKLLRQTVDLMDGKPTGLERSFWGRLLLAFYSAGLTMRQENRRYDTGQRYRDRDDRDRRYAGIDYDQPLRREYDRRPSRPQRPDMDDTQRVTPYRESDPRRH